MSMAWLKGTKTKISLTKIKARPSQHAFFKILVDCGMSQIEVASSVSVHMLNLRGQNQSRYSTLEFLENLI